MIWIGIDPGTKCGWAVLDADGARLASGTWQLERRRGDGAGMLYVRFQRLFRELLECYSVIGLHANETKAVICYEQQANRFSGSAHTGLGIISHIQRIGEEFGIPYTGVTFSTVKKVATEHGGSKKALMVAASRSRWGDAIEGEDEADALWIAETARVGAV